MTGSTQVRLVAHTTCGPKKKVLTPIPPGKSELFIAPTPKDPEPMGPLGPLGPGPAGGHIIIGPVGNAPLPMLGPPPAFGSTIGKNEWQASGILSVAHLRCGIGRGDRAGYGALSIVNKAVIFDT